MLLLQRRHCTLTTDRQRGSSSSSSSAAILSACRLNQQSCQGTGDKSTPNPLQNAAGWVDG